MSRAIRCVGVLHPHADDTPVSIDKLILGVDVNERGPREQEEIDGQGKGKSNDPDADGTYGLQKSHRTGIMSTTDRSPRQAFSPGPSDHVLLADVASPRGGLPPAQRMARTYGAR